MQIVLAQNVSNQIVSKMPQQPSAREPPPASAHSHFPPPLPSTQSRSQPEALRTFRRTGCRRYSRCRIVRSANVLLVPYKLNSIATSRASAMPFSLPAPQAQQLKLS